MHIDLVMKSPLAEAARTASSAEAQGYDGIWTAENGNDPFLPLALAASATESVTLGTAIAVAFARNPMTMAQVGWELNALSKGRFVLGLGSQIKPHITKRYSMPWSDPAARMREIVQAMRAIWHTWSTGADLDFRGEFYTHTLMTPMFFPQEVDYGAPRVNLAGVGPLMTRVAGETADGFFCHLLTSSDFVRDVTLPRLAEGRALADRSDAVEVSLPVWVATGNDDESMSAAIAATRERIGFYGSTPAYRQVLEHHGWGELQPRLNAMSKAGEWTEMGDLVSDEMLNTFAVVTEPKDVASELLARFGDVVDRISFSSVLPLDPELERGLADSLRAERTSHGLGS